MKKALILLCIVFGLLLLLGCAAVGAYHVDTSRVEGGEPPLFSICTTTLNDGGSKVYYGIGYQIIVWNQMTSGPNRYKTGYESHLLTQFVDPLNGPNVALTNAD